MSRKALTEKVAELLRSSRLAVALTGAGLSVESGIPAFRGSQGLWDRYDPLEYAHIEAFRADPKKVWEMLAELGGLVERAQPNAAHRGLARLEEMGYLRAVITQNIDALHQRAGSREVIEFHGNGQRLICLGCGRRYAQDAVALGTLPPRCSCRGVLKPDVVFFGEPIPTEAGEKALAYCRRCDLLLVIGTSAVVAPASHLPLIAKQQGARIVEINLERTHLSETVADVVLETSASQALNDILEFLGR